MTKQKQVKQTQKDRPRSGDMPSGRTDKTTIIKTVDNIVVYFESFFLQQQNNISYINFIVATIASYKA